MATAPAAIEVLVVVVASCSSSSCCRCTSHRSSSISSSSSSNSVSCELKLLIQRATIILLTRYTMMYMLSLCVTKSVATALASNMSCLVTQSHRFDIVQCRCRTYIYPGVK